MFSSQIQFHPYNYLEHKKLLKYCEKHGIIIEAYGSLAYGAFTLT